MRELGRGAPLSALFFCLLVGGAPGMAAASESPAPVAAGPMDPITIGVCTAALVTGNPTLLALCATLLSVPL